VFTADAATAATRVTAENVDVYARDAMLARVGLLLGWRRGVVVSGVRRMNEVNARRARLQLGWVTVFGRVYHLGL